MSNTVTPFMLISSGASIDSTGAESSRLMLTVTGDVTDHAIAEFLKDASWEDLLTQAGGGGD